MERLARRGHHRAAGLPDLLLAAIAERHSVRLLHYDADFDVVATATGQPMQWVVPRGSVP
jgi:predicted nucleic acid-binding protein